jgi:hypothetical protein
LEHYEIPSTLASKQDGEIAENSTEKDRDGSKAIGHRYRKVNPPQKRTK